MPESSPGITLETPAGTLQLLRVPARGRFLEVRRARQFAFTLPRDNVVQRHLTEVLSSDLGGGVALNLIERAAIQWFVKPTVPVSHDPEDMAQVEDTDALREAIGEIARVLRAEINAGAIERDAMSRIDGDFIYGSPGAIQIGRRTKASPDLPEQYFGRLAPLGVTTLRTVAPYVGFVSALGLEDWFYWAFRDSWSGSRVLDVDPLDTEVWVRPAYAAVNRAVEMAAVSMEIPAAVGGLGDLPEIRFACEELSICRPLNTVLAKRLRLVSNGVLNRAVTRIIPVEVTGLPWNAFPANTKGLDEVAETRGVRTLLPYGRDEGLRRIMNDAELLHCMLLAADQEGTRFPADPWQYVDEDQGKHRLPGGTIVYYPLDEPAFRSAVGALLLEGKPEEDPRDSAARSVVRALRDVHHSIGRLEDSIEASRSLGLHDAPLDRMKASLAEARLALEDAPPLQELAAASQPAGDDVQGDREGDAPPQPVSRLTGSPHRSTMPDGTVVGSREERFAHNLEVARAYAEEHGHLRPRKAERPQGVNLYQWLKNQETRIRRGTMPAVRRAALEDLSAWRQRTGRDHGESE
jgi:hypothetical protein